MPGSVYVYCVPQLWCVWCFKVPPLLAYYQLFLRLHTVSSFNLLVEDLKERGRLVLWIWLQATKSHIVYAQNKLVLSFFPCHYYLASSHSVSPQGSHLALPSVYLLVDVLFVIFHDVVPIWVTNYTMLVPHKLATRNYFLCVDIWIFTTVLALFMLLVCLCFTNR